MAATIVVLTERALAPTDVQHLAALHEGEDVTFRVLVPADVHRSLLADVLDHLSLLELRGALGSVRGDADEHADAPGALAGSLTALREAGLTADGALVDDDPVRALERAVADTAAAEVVVVTRPHAVEDTFHTDWASQARHRLGVPVLHVYAGTTFLG